MKGFFAFLVAHGYWFMGTGMVLAIAGVLIMMEPRNRMGTMRLVGTGIGIAGFVIYFIGRVCVVLDRRRARNARSSAQE